jgi:hypothetical protein
MLRGEDAVGGFFEDLPVLALVLLGVFLLVSTSGLASRELSGRRELERLESVAEDIAKAILGHLSSGDGTGHMPTVQAMRQLNLRALADPVASCAGYCASVVLMHPSTEWLSSATTGDILAAQHVVYAGGFLNAALEDGSVAIVEVNVLAW